MAKDLERMSFKELQELELKLKKAKASVAGSHARRSFAQAGSAWSPAPASRSSDLFGGRGGKGRNVAAKYANPDDPSETWTGRGRKPRWLAAKLKDGDKHEKFLIK